MIQVLDTRPLWKIASNVMGDGASLLPVGVANAFLALLACVLAVAVRLFHYHARILGWIKLRVLREVATFTSTFSPTLNCDVICLFRSPFLRKPEIRSIKHLS